MAYIVKRRLSTGEFRYDLRYRRGSRLATETFRRRRDAEARQRRIEADELAGTLVDPRKGRIGFDAFADSSRSSLPVGACSCTILGKSEIVLLRTGEEAFRVECWRSFSDYVFTFLTEAARDAAA